jgi:multidrug efflux pump
MAGKSLFFGIFINRPNFAIVIAIVITLAGLLALSVIPVAQYPNLQPPQVSVSATYPGASADTIAKTVGEPIEEQVNGVPGMIYMQSTNSSSGTYNLTVTFALGTDPNIDQVNVQNRVQLAQAQLPTQVVQEGLTIRTAASNFVLAVNLYSPDNKYDQIFISNYAYMHLQQLIARIPGVGNTSIMGQRQYAMRIWLDPVRMTSLGITPSDVTAAIQAQNIQVAAGQIGAPPVSGGQQQQLTILAPGQLSSVPEFENIVIRTNPDGGVVRIRDIARVELGAQKYNDASALDGSPSATVAIYQTPNANALQVANAVQTQMKQLAQAFPPGLQYAIVYNATNFVTANITEILRTLAITLILVVAVVYLFLQDWRATLIPAIAIPVSLIGVFAVLYAIGYSVNTVDLFAVVLAITLVVDDAIVVVENVARNLEEHPDRSVAQATLHAIQEVAGPVIATTLVLVAVFAPVGFVAGITGSLYRQFAVTISVSVLISGVNALTLTPALCALILRPPQKAQFMLFRWFNHGFDFARDNYVRTVGFLSRWLVLTGAVIVVVIGATYLFFQATPISFLPEEDQGYFFVNVQTPSGASLGRTEAAVQQVSDQLRKTPGVAHTLALDGFSIINGAQSAESGSVIAIMQPWAQRSASESVAAVIAKVQPQFGAMPEAQITSFNPASIPGISAAGGLNFVLEARAGQSIQDLASVTRALIFAANQNPNLSSVFTGFSASVPQLLLHVDTTRAALSGVTPAEIYQTLSANLGGQFVNDFNYQNFVFQVLVQADAQFRQTTSDIDKLYVRSSSGAMVPLSSLVTVSTIQGADATNNYNLYPATLINGAAAAGKSSGQATTAMEEVAKAHLPAGYGYEWTGISYQELQAAGQEGAAFLFAIVFSFLFLVALYESWTLPLSVMIPVTFAVLGGLLAIHLRGLALDVYGQIGLVLLIGLAAKNAILIVAFAQERLKRGNVTVRDAADEGARTRYRPVMMTALAFIIGVVPLVVATGAGAGGRKSIGTTVFGGMILASFVGVLFVPVLFVGFELLAENASRFLRGERRKRSA